MEQAGARKGLYQGLDDANVRAIQLVVTPLLMALLGVYLDHKLGTGPFLAIGLGVLGGAIGQGRAAAAALEGISRNPGAAARIQTPMILGLALIESLVLLSFVIAFFLERLAEAV